MQRDVIAPGFTRHSLRVCRLLAAVLCALVRHSSGYAQDAGLTPAQTEGRAIALDLRERRPTHSLTNTGILRLRDAKGKRTELRAEFETTLTANGWENVYRTVSTNSGNATPAMHLAVIHRENQPVEYRLYELRGDVGEAKEFQTLKGNAAMIPFAGSDFWLADLGLEFLHWPGQRLLKKEMHSSEFCYKLESLNPQPAPGIYVRVISWIHTESGALIEAEAYDAKNKLLKSFEPKELKRIGKGQYELKSMEMRNEQADTRTRIEFDLEIK